MFKYRLYILSAFYIIVTLAVFTVFTSRGCFLQPNEDRSMPELTPNSFYYIGKKFRTADTLSRGDIILYSPRDENAKPVASRIIALPGDRVRVAEGKLYVNDELLESAVDASERLDKNSVLPEITLPKNFLFVLPDLRRGVDPADRINFIHVHQVKGKILSSLFKNDSL